MVYSNVNLAAPVGALAFVGTGFLILLFVLISMGSLIAKRYRIFKLSLVAPLLTLLLYFALMLGFSLAGSQYVLARGEEKYFCELDCHLAYSLVDVNKRPTLGTGASLQTANGVFYVVTIRTRFDPTTIGPTRGNGPLTPNPRSVVVVDSSGHTHQPTPVAESGLPVDHIPQSPLVTSLRPGEFYSTVFVFDLPKSIQNPLLLITESDPLTRLIIGHENSLGHRKTVFEL